MNYESMDALTMKAKLVNVSVTGEGGDYMIQVTPAQVKQLKKLLKRYTVNGVWLDEINDIIDGATKVSTVGTINTSGDGGGWYDNE